MLISAPDDISSSVDLRLETIFTSPALLIIEAPLDLGLYASRLAARSRSTALEL